MSTGAKIVARLTMPNVGSTHVYSELDGCIRSALSNTSNWLHVDHDHSCCDGGYSCGECVRGVLCHNHNRAIGLFRDDPDALNTAAEYLNQWAMSR
jgi:hypothetical protein